MLFSLLTVPDPVRIKVVMVMGETAAQLANILRQYPQLLKDFFDSVRNAFCHFNFPQFYFCPLRTF